MEILKADILGFCFGVRRAVELAYKALDENKNQKVYSLGPLIHNEIVLNKLESKGLSILSEDDLQTIEPESVIIIRAHGVSPEVLHKIESKKCKIIDATCPRVKASQKIVQKYSADKIPVILTGDKNHGEVKGIAGYASENFILIENSDDAKTMINKGVFNKLKSVFVLSQTTFSLSEFEKITDLLKKEIPEVIIQNTICSATKERQEALLKLCKEVDGVLVIGGKSSANTIRLFNIAQKNCKYALHVQSSDELTEEIRKMNRIGITAGASTPDEIIEEVEHNLMEKSY